MKAGANPSLDSIDIDSLTIAFKKLSVRDLKMTCATSKRHEKLGTSLLEPVAKKMLQFKNLQIPLDLDLAFVESYLHLVLGNSYLETVKLSWEEQSRELSLLVKNPNIDENVRKILKESQKLPCDEKSFLLRNTQIDKVNYSLFDNDKTKAAFNNGTLKASKKGLTRIPYTLILDLIGLKADTGFSPGIVNFNNNEIKYLPRLFLITNKQLVFLELKNNQIVNIPDEVAQLNNLECVELQGNNICDMTAKVGIKLSTITFASASTPSKVFQRRPESISFLGTLSNSVKKFLKANFIILSSTLGLDYLNAFPSDIKIPFESKLTTVALLSSFAYWMKRDLFDPIIIQPFYDYRQTRYWSLCEQYPDIIKKDTIEAEAYLNGRKAQHWAPYLKSFLNRSSYNNAFYVGLHDKKNHLHSRIEGTDETFKEKMKKSPPWHCINF